MSEQKKAAAAPSDLSAVYEALNRSQAVIEFELDGTVISANENFLNAELFCELFLRPLESRRENVGLLVFEFST